MTDEKKKTEQGEDIVNKGKKERQKTMDKLSIDSSVAHTYDKNAADDDEKCSQDLNREGVQKDLAAC